MPHFGLSTFACTNCKAVADCHSSRAPSAWGRRRSSRCAQAGQLLGQVRALPPASACTRLRRAVPRDCHASSDRPSLAADQRVRRVCGVMQPSLLKRSEKAALSAEQRTRGSWLVSWVSRVPVFFLCLSTNIE